MKEAKAREGIGVMLYTKKLKIFTGNANPELAKEIAVYLGIGLGDVQVSYFSDGEIGVTINESVRGADVFVIQPTCPPTNKNVMELLIMIDDLSKFTLIADLQKPLFPNDCKSPFPGVKHLFEYCFGDLPADRPLFHKLQHFHQV
jgi:hypothetical protein